MRILTLVVNQAEFNALWTQETMPFCQTGMTLLNAFATKHPARFASIDDLNYIDVDRDEFAGIPEWERLGEHVGECPDCNAL